MPRLRGQVHVSRPCFIGLLRYRKDGHLHTKEKKRRLCKSVDIHALCTIRGATVTSHLSPGCSFLGIPAERIRCTDSVPSAVYILDSSRTMYKSRSPKKLPPVALPARAGVTVDFVRRNHNTGILCYSAARPRGYTHRAGRAEQEVYSVVRS